MANFEFSKKIINFRICNKIYSVEDNNNLAEKLINFGESMKEKANEISEKDDYAYYKKVTTDLCNDCYKFIDSLLGSNSSKKIFKDRTYDIEDCFSLLDFIKSEIEIQRNQRLSKYSSLRISRNQNFKKRK